jgi:hypothetical protein
MAYNTRFNALEKEDRCHTPHGSTLQCHRTVHFDWLHKLLLYVSPSRARILKPLMDQSGLTTYFIDGQNSKAFVKCFAYGCNSIACPDHNKWFGIHNNASDFQLGTCIIQEGRPVAYFSCKLMMT